jgi:predicted RNase H-like HicB family nuclease
MNEPNANSYLVVIEAEPDGSFSAFVPDLPGCVACGDTREQVQGLIREAVELHIDLMKQSGEAIPPARATSFSIPAA